MSMRREMLEKATGIVDSDRDQEYGGPERSFGDIALLWSWWINRRTSDRVPTIELTAVDVAIMMDLLKTARLSTNIYHEDSWIDKAGYSACGYECAFENVKQEEES